MVRVAQWQSSGLKTHVSGVRFPSLTRCRRMRNSWALTNVLLKLKSNGVNHSVIDLQKYIGQSTYSRYSNFFYSFVFCLRVVKLKLKGKTLRFKRFGRYYFYFKFGITHPACSILHCGSYFKRKGKQKF